MIVWLFGKSASGKTTIINEIKKDSRFKNILYVNSDSLREHINSDLTYTVSDRIENHKRLAKLIKSLQTTNPYSTIVIDSMAPFKACRDIIRDNLKQFDLYLLYIATEFDECVKRDPKGLYKVKYDEMVSMWEEPHYEDCVLTLNNDEEGLMESCIDLIKNILEKNRGCDYYAD